MHTAKSELFVRTPHKIPTFNKRQYIPAKIKLMVTGQVQTVTFMQHRVLAYVTLFQISVKIQELDVIFFAIPDQIHFFLGSLVGKPVSRPNGIQYPVAFRQFVKTGMVSYVDTLNGNGKACWTCHTQVPHTKVSNLSSTPNAIVPLPGSKLSGMASWLENKQ